MTLNTWRRKNTDTYKLWNRICQKTFHETPDDPKKAEEDHWQALSSDKSDAVERRARSKSFLNWCVWFFSSEKCAVCKPQWSPGKNWSIFIFFVDISSLSLSVQLFIKKRGCHRLKLPKNSKILQHGSANGAEPLNFLMHLDLGRVSRRWRLKI